jgi:hypothetical protein
MVMSVKYILVPSCLQYHSQFVRFRPPLCDSAWLPAQQSQKMKAHHGTKIDDKNTGKKEKLTITHEG